MDTKRFKTSIRTKVLLGFGTAIIILLTAGIISYHSFQDLIRSLDFLSRPDIKLVKLNDLLSDLSLSENHIRSYFISNEKKYLNQYHLYEIKLKNNIDSLSYLTNESERESDKIKRIARLLDEKKKHTQDLIDLYENKQERKLPDGILKKLNEANPDVPTITITKTITINNVPVIENEVEELKEENETNERRSFISRLLKRKDKQDSSTNASVPPLQVMRETTTIIDTIYSVGRANEVKEEAFTRILENIRNQNYKSRKAIKENESEIIQKDINLIEYIRTIIIDLKNTEQKVTEKNVKQAKKIVEVSIIKIVVFGLSGISAILIFGFMIMNDVTRNNYHKNQLLNAKIQADELIKAKENFLATMSHEIRTPLNSIVGFTEQLSQTSMQNRQKYFLQAVSNSTTHLLSLVNDILDHSRLEAGKIEFENTSFSLKEVIEEVCDAFYIKAAEKHLTLTYSIIGDVQILIGDPLRLKQILFNLVANAIKFTDNGSVFILCEKTLLDTDEINVNISIRDTGIGIPSDKINNIFDSFSQADSSISRKFGGTGLGLSISKKLVELQGGKIAVNSQLGLGSEFTFSINYKKSSVGPTIELQPQAPDLNVLSGMRILIVEDDEFNLLLFHTILLKWNMKVRMVSSGKEALQILDQEMFDLILTDIHMPDMSGIDLFKKIRTLPDENKSTIPVLAVTANVIKESMQVFKDSGFAEILLKPFKEEQLANAILKASGKENLADIISESSLSPGKTIQEHMFGDFIKFSGGDMVAVHTMVEVFITNSSNQLTLLKTHLKDKNWEMLKETVHKLIPGFGHLHNYKMTDLLEEVEVYLHQTRIPDEVKLQTMIELILKKGYEQIKELEKLNVTIL